jgi:hypothetical protein
LLPVVAPGATQAVLVMMVEAEVAVLEDFEVVTVYQQFPLQPVLLILLQLGQEEPLLLEAQEILGQIVQYTYHLLLSLLR